MDDDRHEFLTWEKASRDTVDFKRIYEGSPQYLGVTV